MRSSSLSVAALLLCGCAAVPRSAQYSELIRLRGATLTLLQSRALSAAEARQIEQELDVARREVDIGAGRQAQVQLDAVRVYLAARQGTAL